jgi:chromosome partitioning protein
MKGGVGKSTIAANVSVHLQADMLDLDALGACVWFNKMRKDNGFEPLVCLTAKTEDGLISILREYQHSAKTLVIDSGGYDSRINRIAMDYSDYLITPVSHSQMEVNGLQRFLEIIRKANKVLGKQIKTNVVINKADVRRKADINELKSFVNSYSELALMDSVIYERADFQRAYQLGISVEELGYHSKAAQELRSLCREIQQFKKHLK